MKARGLTGHVLHGVTVGLLVLGAAGDARAQVGCRTPNCNLATSPPAGCVNRASPHTTTVNLTDSGINFIYVPQNPKIEPGGCIVWQAVGNTVNHSSSADDCNDTNACMVFDPTCEWDSGNISSLDATPREVCFYDPLAFPPTTSDGFYCRIHSTPAHAGTMFGTLRITSPIDLALAKSGNDIVLTWTGGGVPLDVTYKVVRSLVGDPLFPVGPNTVTGNPTGGTTGTTFTEAAGLIDPANHYYLIRNKQINEL